MALNLEKPESSIKVKLYETEFEIKYPNSGQVIDIAVLKAKLSENQYTALSSQFSAEAPLALRLIDVYAFLTVMVPNFRENLAKKSLYELETFESIELVHIYDSQINPWLEKWTEYINNRIKELKENTKSSKSQLV